MRSYVFTLRVPAEAPYRALASDVGRRVVELGGGTAEDAVQFAVALADAIEALVRLVHPDRGDLDVAFHTGGVGLEVTVRCGGRSSVVRHRLPAGQS